MMFWNKALGASLLISMVVFLSSTAMVHAKASSNITNPQNCSDIATKHKARLLVADVVAIDHPIVFNRLGAQNVNWMMYALRHDVIDLETNKTLDYSDEGDKRFEKVKYKHTSRDIALRPDLRPRPLVLRVAAGDYLEVRFTNLLHHKLKHYGDVPPNYANPFDPLDPLPNIDHPMERALKDAKGPLEIYKIDDQVASRTVGFHPQGLELVTNIADDSSYVGKNKNSMAAPGETKTYCFYAPEEGAYLVSSDGAVFGGEGTSGNSGVGLFGAVTVQPKGANFYRAQVTEEEMRLATSKEKDEKGKETDKLKKTPTGQPNINYGAFYPDKCSNPQHKVWCDEGKAGKPILDMVYEDWDKKSRKKIKRIWHGDINAIIVGPNDDGSFPATTYPLEAIGKRNPTLPNRLEPFREFVSIFHDENAATQAFPYFFEHPELKHTLHGVRDSFMINYGSGGVGAEIIANRLQTGPMQDCLDCAYEEFFLSSFAVGDPAMLVDKPANLITSQCQPEYVQMIKDSTDPEGKREIPDPKYKDQRQQFCTQKNEYRATEAYYPHDPANVHHSYIGDFVKFRNLHSGKEQHIFHLHNHQWLFNPNDDNSNYIDAQGIGPGSGYTYEIAFGGSGNRNKTVGDAIFHCHYYPHFAQGMWYMWRNHDVFEAGTRLEVSEVNEKGESNKDKIHTDSFALKSGKPFAKARALPDGEIVAGVPIPAIVPLPGKGMAPMPEDVHVVEKENKLGSKAVLAKPFSNTETKNPGYPFWIAGVTEHDKYQASIGSRPTTPPLDMCNENDCKETFEKYSVKEKIVNDLGQKAEGHNGGLPRHALAGFSAKGEAHSKIDRFTAEKHIRVAKPILFDEEGTALEKLAMVFHKKREHSTTAIDINSNESVAKFITNGAAPVPGAPFNDPCIDDKGYLLKNTKDQLEIDDEGNLSRYRNSSKKDHDFHFFGGKKDKEDFILVQDKLIEFGANNPRIYKGANIQLDVVFNKLGYHYPQQRILALWEDVGNLLNKTKPPEPLVMRLNTFDCAMYAHTNLVPEVFYGDDYQITTPTDVIGQHIHLPKWDLTSADGSANGWNYEDGTFSPTEVRKRIAAINTWMEKYPELAKDDKNIVEKIKSPLIPKEHPYFNGTSLPQHQKKFVQCEKEWNDAVKRGEEGYLEFERKFGIPGNCNWLGARTTLQRWFSDPIVNRQGIHRGLGTTFTHDHLGPSTHQQLGLYATMLSEPPGSEWRHNETGEKLYDTAKRKDGGPTSWQAVITGKDGQCIDVDGDSEGNCNEKGDDSHREFFLQFGDFQHAYVKGAYYGVNEHGVGWILQEPGKQTAKTTPDSFRFAINPSVRKPAAPVFPDIIAFEPTCPGGRQLVNKPYEEGGPLPGSVYWANDFSNTELYNDKGEPLRPCPEAISADDIGMMVVNYRNEPLGARVYDPDKIGPDGKKGMQAEGEQGDLAFAMQTRKDRAIPELNTIEGNTPYAPLTFRNFEGDPFTPILRAYSGDKIRVKIQGGAHEHEHNSSINALAWMQGGSGYGQAPHSGWRNSQNAGLSEQFTFTASITDHWSRIAIHDRMYTVDTSQDGLWNGVWGIIRSRNTLHISDKLAVLPNNPLPTVIAPKNFKDIAERGACPNEAPLREYAISAVLANEVLDNPKGVVIPAAPRYAHLDDKGGTLSYNPRDTAIQIQVRDGKIGDFRIRGTVNYGVTGPLHDPTAIMFVRDEDLVKGKNGIWRIKSRDPNKTEEILKPIEPLVLRAAAGECIKIKLTNRLPADHEKKMPDLDGYTSLSGIIIRDKGTSGSKMTTFNNNLIRPSNHIGLHPQLVHYDVHESDGNNIGLNANSLVSPRGKSIKIETVDNETIEYEYIYDSKEYFWYAGGVDVRMDDACLVEVDREYHDDALEQLNNISMLSFRKKISKNEPNSGLKQFVEEIKNKEEKNIKSDLRNLLIENIIDKKLDKESFYFEESLVSRFLNYVARLEEKDRDYFHDKLSEEYWIWRSDERGGSIGSDSWLYRRLGLRDSIGNWLYRSGSTRILQLEAKGRCSTPPRYVPVEFGGTNLTPPDRIKQGQKGAIGALVIEPEGSTWVENDQVIDRQNPGSNQSNKRMTRTMADVTYPVIEANGEKGKRIFRDLTMIHQKGLNLRYKDGSAVPNIAAEKTNPGELTDQTAPEDAHDSGHMAINYGAEPMWFRFGLPPDVDFGKPGLGGVDKAWEAFSNQCCHDSGNIGTVASGVIANVREPYVPIMKAYAGHEMRIRALMPTGTGRGSTVELHGHNWMRDPYLAEHVEEMMYTDGFDEKDNPIIKSHAYPKGGRPVDWGMPSKCIGENALAMQLGGQESLTPMAHFDLVFPSAGGKHKVKGDYLWRDHAGFGITNGLWAIIRVENAPEEFINFDNDKLINPGWLRTNCVVPLASNTTSQ